MSRSTRSGRIDLKVFDIKTSGRQFAFRLFIACIIKSHPQSRMMFGLMMSPIISSSRVWQEKSRH